MGGWIDQSTDKLIKPAVNYTVRFWIRVAGGCTTETLPEMSTFQVYLIKNHYKPHLKHLLNDNYLWKLCDFSPWSTTFKCKPPNK